jgi:predicted DCC family thiol-disulfide oxidoreductase YuxK
MRILSLRTRAAAQGGVAHQGISSRAILSLSLLLVWLAIATQVVPPLISRAYDGQSWPLFNALIISRHEHPLAEYLAYWRNVTWLGVIWVLGFWLGSPLRAFVSSDRFFERAVGAATPASLGAIRAWTCGILLVMTLWEDLASTALLPRSMVQPKGVLHLLHAAPVGFDRFLASTPALWTFEWITILLLALGVLGLATRLVVPAAAVCCLIVAGIFREYAWFYHTGLIPIYVLAVLSFMPCGDGWSLDRIIRTSRGAPVPPNVAHPRYGWSRYAVWTVIAVPYVGAGMSKLYYSGFQWLDADNMKATLLRTTLAPMQFDWTVSIDLLRAPDVVFVGLAALGLFTELLFGFVLVSARARRVLPAMMALTHSGILFLQNILFVDLILLQAVFYDFTPVRRAIGRFGERRGGRLQVLYDGDCGLCQRSIRVLQGLDIFELLRWVDFRTTQVEADRSRLEHEMAAVTRGRTFFGFSAYRAMAWRIPAFWPILPLLYLPGVRLAGDHIYRRIAARRHGICHVEPASSALRDDVRRIHVRGATVSLAVAAFLLSWWMTHIEFYPFTTMKMFAALNRPPGRISYVTPLAVHEDGSMTLARFEQWIGAMADARYRRIISLPFSDQNSANRTNDFLEASMRAANRNARAGSRVIGFDLQLWEWDFVGDPANEQHGHLIQTYRYRPSE